MSGEAAGLPQLHWPGVSPAELEGLAPAAIGLALVSFTSGMVTARSFAARNRYEIDVDRELIAIGLCNIAASLSQGFAVTGADSRTAVNDAMGGKSQVTGLVAAATMTMVLLWLTGPLRYLPVCALGAVMISAAWGLFDWKAMVRLSRIREGELIVCVAAMLGVVAIGALQGILLAVGLSLVVLLVRSSRPSDALLGRVEGVPGFHNVARYEGTSAIPGVVLYRFNAPLIFINAAYFKRRVLEAVAGSPGARWFIVDAAPMVHLDSTGADVVAALAGELGAAGKRLVIAGTHTRVEQLLQRSGALEQLGAGALFPTLRSAVDACASSDHVGQ
jgi:MFS superfamily sulfate permease-like transporter